MDALLLVDVQQDFLPGGALAVEDGDRILPIINVLQEKFALVVASKDWHPADHISFERWPVHCVQKSPGADFPPGLDTEKIAYVVLKGQERGVEAYSAFCDGALEPYLREKGVDHLTVVGLTTEYCVKETVLDALKCGFRVTVVREGCAAIGDATAAFEQMQRAGARLV